MLEPGRTLSHYRLVEKIGEGGMGVVWRATDTRLGREVAIKVLPEVFAGDADRLARFEREARLLAALNHPRIGAIHGLERDGETRLLVLELIEGENLDERLRRGALPVRESLDIVRQIGEALEAAHEAGILHRDLKPANVKVTPAGEVKVLDFGLAKAIDPDAASVDASLSPTLSIQATRAGVILGTAAYMSPEQARGKSVDRRTDVWAFGCILYQCLTGRPPFEGETVSDVLARILERDPDWGRLPPGVPLQVRDLLQRCLQKDPRARLRDLGDARLEIERTLATADPSGVFPLPAEPIARRSAPWMWLAAGLAAGALIVLLATALLPSRSTGAWDRSVRLTLPLPEGVTLPLRVSRPVAISPDGNRIVFVASDEGKQQLYLRDLDATDIRPLAGTEGAGDPFFSPDGRSIGFIDNDFKAYRMSLTSTTPVDLIDTPILVGASWSGEDYIYYTPYEIGLGSHRIWRIPLRGGEPEEITRINDPSGSEIHLWPSPLPDGSGLLFNRYENFAFDRGRAMLLRLSPLELIELALPDGAACLRFLPPESLLFCVAGALHAVPFDPQTGEILGASVVVQESILTNPDSLHSAVHLSNEGTMVYVIDHGSAGGRRLALASPDEEIVPLHEDLRMISSADLAPDGTRVALVIPRGQGLQGDLWIYDLRRRTFDSAGEVLTLAAIWSHDGQSIYASQFEAGGGSRVARRRRGGRGEPELVYRSAGFAFPQAVTPDGKHVIVMENRDQAAGNQLFLVPVDGEGEGEPLLFGEDYQGHIEVSPDGRLVAYTSNRTGSREVFVALFDEVEAGIRVSRQGGTEPFWSADGNELYFRQGNDWVVVAVRREPKLDIGDVRGLFSMPPAPIHFFSDDRGVGVTPEGRLILLLDPADDTSLTRIEVAIGWFSELERRLREAH